MPKQTKYIFVTGGVISGLGKGILTASTGLLLKNHGYKVSVLKADMYLNLDAGTMNPLEHGEVFVTEDGLETDQDLGHYERFLNINLVKHNYLTMGKVYYDVITRDRQLGYSGKCVEGHIHVPEEVIRLIRETGQTDDADVLLIEVGGTVGEYQNIMFYEAIRRLKQMEPDNVFLIHLVYLPIPQFLGEMKSKPAQASIYELYKLGLQPTFVVCRSDKEVDEKRRKTIAVNTGVKLEHIFSDPDVDTIYKIPLVLKEQDYDLKLLKELQLAPSDKPDTHWFDYISKVGQTQKSVKVGIAGKYYTSGDFSLQDAYVCVVEAIKHASWKLGVTPNIEWFDVEDVEDPQKFSEIEKAISACDAIIVPQGWGSRGVEGKLKVVEIARNKKIPYLGLCFGMQMSVIEFARNVLGLKDANSEEANAKTTNPVVHIMPDQKEYLESKNYGGTIRLGAWPCQLENGTILEEVYKKYGTHRIVEGGIVMERHRHRYEYNNDYRQKLVEAGLVISGTSPDGKLVESVELPRNIHPYFVGTQFHPEYKSRPLDPHPTFVGLIEAAIKKTGDKVDTLI